MDSLTQIVLGAAVGEAVCGKKIGNKAIVWGAVAGTIPDLDVLVRPFVDLVTELEFHRSITHSFFFAIFASPIFGALLLRLYKNEKAIMSDWTLLFFWGFVTHALLDAFTTWGTQLFYPFSNWRVAFESIFVIDPLYTLPFLGFVIAAAFYHRESPKRRKLNNLGLYISTAYLLLTVVNKGYMNYVFSNAFVAQKIDIQRFHTKPSALNNILWSATAEAKDGYYIGYHSLLDKDVSVKFFKFEKKHELLDSLKDQETLARLKFIANDYYTIERFGDTIRMNDLRFGQLDGWSKGEGQFVFAYLMKEKNGKLEVWQQPNDIETGKKMLGQFADRILGKQAE